MIYISRTLGREQLFAVNLDGSDPVQVTSDSAGHEDPAWAPDRRGVAFVHIARGHEVVYVMNVDGSGTEAVTDSAMKTIHPFWSPDSKKIA
jgi:TolB protein